MKSIINKFMIYLLLLLFSINAFAQVRLGGNPEDLYNFVLSPDGGTLAGCNWDGTIHLWDTATGTEKAVFISEFRIGASGVLTFSPDGTLLASGSEGWSGRVTLWDVATGEAEFSFEHVGGNTISSISFSPDGTTLVSCAAGRWGNASTFVYLWDVEAGEKKSEIEVPESPTCSTYSPDGTTLVIGTLGEDVYLWDIHENIEIARLNTPLFDTGVRYVKFSPDGTTLATGGHLNRPLIMMWDFVTRKETSRLFGYHGTGWIYSFAFTPDGMILAGPGRNRFYLWNVSNGERKIICEPPMFAGVNSNGTIHAVADKIERIDGRWGPRAYFLWTISPENVSMEVAAHGKLATRWSDLKIPD